VSESQAGEKDVLLIAVCEAINPDWNKGAAIVERMNLDAAQRVLAVIAKHLTTESVVQHVQNWVPLGYDYPNKDPYPHVTAAARAILAETANTLVTPPHN